MKLSKRFGTVALLAAIALATVSCGGVIPTCGEVSCESSAGTPEPDGVLIPSDQADIRNVVTLDENGQPLPQAAPAETAETAFTPNDPAPADSQGGATR
jgi:hypothetical protein